MRAQMQIHRAIIGASSMRSLPIALLFFAVSSHAISFDCAKASTLVEKAICSDTELARLDDQLELAYKQALAAKSDGVELKSQQRAWLKNVRNQCQDVACINQAYTKRLAALGMSVDISVPETQQIPVTPPSIRNDKLNTLTASHSKSLKISRSFLSAPLAFQIGGEIDIPFVKFIEAIFRFGKSKPAVKVDGNRVIIRLDTHDELTGEEGRIDYLVVAHEVNGRVWALVERTVITDSDGVRELTQYEIPPSFALVWVPLIASMN